MKFKPTTPEQHAFSRISPAIRVRRSAFLAGFTLPKLRGRPGFTLPKLCERSAFTLLELLVVVGIIAILMVLLVPAFTHLKGANDVTSAAATIKAALEQARTYAQANNTYTWVGFYEENGATASAIPAPDPKCSGCVGRLVISTVASTDGTNLGADGSSSASGTENFIDPTRLKQVAKLIKIENVHLPLLKVGTGDGDLFDTRPILQNDGGSAGYNDSRLGELNGTSTLTATYANASYYTKFPFQFPVGSASPWQYRFRRTIRFGPTGENRLNSTFDIRRIVEIGLIQTHGNSTPIPRANAGTALVDFAGNVVAIQIGGLDGNVKVYRR